jgi:poly-gamma-glutamate capsule biosynthesis protein CapA/YwtB (metallophosphatase superfamily)
MPNHTPDNHPAHRWMPWVGGVLLALALIFGLSRVLIRNHMRAVVAVKHTALAAKSASVTEGVSTRLQFVGDVFWGRLVQTTAEKSGLGHDYLTSKLSEGDRNNYDAWIANFECPVTSRNIPYSLQVSALQFNCRPEYLPTLAKWFTAASQANNHTDNNGGRWGLDQTRTNLQAAGIQSFGTYDMNDANDICEVITVPAETTLRAQTVSMPLALCGYMYVTDATPTDAQLAVMQQYAKVMPVIAMPHMGIEYRPAAEQAKVDAYRRMIDNGADIVIGAHPHVIQNTESYEGKLIVYSEGNFLFDQQTLGRAETLGLGVGVKISIYDPADAKIYEQIAPTCKVYKDDCLAQLTAKIKKRPEMAIKYSMTCYDESSGLPELGSDAACTQAGQRATVSSLKDLSPDW